MYQKLHRLVSVLTGAVGIAIVATGAVMRKLEQKKEPEQEPENEQDE